MEYIDGITIIDTSGIIRFSIKFDPRWNQSMAQSIVGKKFLEVFTELDYQTSTLFQSIEKGIPITYSNQHLRNEYSGEAVIEGTSYPIKINGNIVGAVELSREKRRGTDRKSGELVPCAESGIKDMPKRIQVDFSNRSRYSLSDIVCCNEAMKSQVQYAQAVARSMSPVLILGETGTGKELFAHGIHHSSDRNHKPFVVQNCSAIPESLLEGLLFGTCKGSFTGALDRKGIFEIADGGTLFLDEIHAMPPHLQAKLLRVLQDGFVRRVGAEQEKKIDVRIIAAANMDFDTILSENMIRKDLLYRLSVLVIQIPPLRQREDDIELLTDYFIRKYNAVLNKSVGGIKREVRNMIAGYDWPGNVRELENLVEASMNIVAPDSHFITYTDLPARYRKAVSGYAPAPLKHTLETIERNIISDTLIHYKGNVSESAKALKLPRQTLQQKIKKYGLAK